MRCPHSPSTSPLDVAFQAEFPPFHLTWIIPGHPPMQPSLAHRVLRFRDSCHQGGASELELQAAAKATALGGSAPIRSESKAGAQPGGGLEVSVSEQEKLEGAAESAFSSRGGKLRGEEEEKRTPKTEEGRRNKGERD